MPPSVAMDSGMELDTKDRELFVPQTHNFALGGFGGDFEAVRETRALDEQRVVAGRRERRGEAG
jgi:hypothetical protein